ncbi:MAG TPA: hypothetical protein VFX45_05310 [Solirubrobacterales bacterium]|nr:hypothetical protein [Solirubrobacterales bacterium]
MLFPEAVAEKLGRRGISVSEARELLNNRPVVVNRRTQHATMERRMMIGRTNGGRSLTLIIEMTIDPTDWVVVTGWDSDSDERRMRLK